MVGRVNQIKRRAMKRVERMIKLFDEEVKLSKDIYRGMSWMTPIEYRRNQESLRKKYERNQAKQAELANRMTFEEKEELYRQTDINLNEP